METIEPALPLLLLHVRPCCPLPVKPRWSWRRPAQPLPPQPARKLLTLPVLASHAACILCGSVSAGVGTTAWQPLRVGPLLLRGGRLLLIAGVGLRAAAQERPGHGVVLVVSERAGECHRGGGAWDRGGLVSVGSLVGAGSGAWAVASVVVDVVVVVSVSVSVVHLLAHAVSLSGVGCLRRHHRVLGLREGVEAAVEGWG